MRAYEACPWRAMEEEERTTCIVLLPRYSWAKYTSTQLGLKQKISSSPRVTPANYQDVSPFKPAHSLPC
jgi:hypothetical protein